MTPSDILHVEDGVILTDEQKIEAAKMVESEQLRRRDPQAHLELMREQERERDLQRFKQLQSVMDHTRSPGPGFDPTAYPPLGTQQLRATPQASLTWNPYNYLTAPAPFPPPPPPHPHTTMGGT